MTSQYDKAIAEVNETFNFYMSMLAERKVEVVKELEKLYSSKQVALSVFGQKVEVILLLSFTFFTFLI